MAEAAKKDEKHGAEKEKPPSKGSARYGNPPKIKAKEAPKATGSTGPSKQGEAKTDTPGAAPKADVMAGTDGIKTPEKTVSQGAKELTTRHSAEREEMSKRHAKEAHQLHSRHGSEHEAMIKKHKNDFGTIGGFPGDGGGDGGAGAGGAGGGAAGGA